MKGFLPSSGVAISSPSFCSILLSIIVFTKLFSKNNDLLEKSEIESKENEKYKMFEDLFGENSIQQIQVLYENGKLEENEMPEEKIEELKKLYVDQIIQMDEDSLKFKNSL